MQKPRDWLESMKHSSTAQTMRHLRVEVMELCESAGLYQIDLLNGSKERVSEAEYWARRRGQQKLDLANAALTVAGQQPRQKKFETVKDILREQISSVLYRAVNFEEFSDRLIQQYGIAVKESRGCLSYLPLAEPSLSERNISVTSSIRRQCLPRCRQTPNANPRRSSSRMPSGNWWIFRRS